MLPVRTYLDRVSKLAQCQPARNYARSPMTKERDFRRLGLLIAWFAWRAGALPALSYALVYVKMLTPRRARACLYSAR